MSDEAVQCPFFKFLMTNILWRTMELLCNVPVTIAPATIALPLLLVCFFKNNLNDRPAKWVSPSSRKFIPKRKIAIPASDFHISIETSISKQFYQKVQVIGFPIFLKNQIFKKSAEIV